MITCLCLCRRLTQFWFWPLFQYLITSYILCWTNVTFQTGDQMLLALFLTLLWHLLLAFCTQISFSTVYVIFQSCCTGYWYWYLICTYVQFLGTGTCTCMPSTGNCTGTWTTSTCTGTGTGTCKKVLVAKTNIFCCKWHTRTAYCLDLYLWSVTSRCCVTFTETLCVWTTGFYVQVSMFGTIYSS